MPSKDYVGMSHVSGPLQQILEAPQLPISLLFQIEYAISILQNDMDIDAKIRLA